MASWSAWLVRFHLEWIWRPKASYSNAEAIRTDLQATYLRSGNVELPRYLGPHIVLDRVDVNEWPLYRVSFSSNSEKGSSQAPRRAMLYCHGGGFYKEVTPGHWSFAAQVARSTGLDVLMPIYPLVLRPPATAEKHAEGFVEIFRLYPHPIVCLGGDSAGGTMATATMYRLLDAAPDHAARVRALVLISPLLDCALDHPELRRLEKTDPWLVADSLRSVTRLWAADLPMAHFRVSPLHGDVSRLPPLLLLCGTSDMLCADARRLSAKFHGKDASEGIGGSADLDKFTYIETKDMLHVYALLPHWEGAQAREVIVHYISKQLE